MQAPVSTIDARVITTQEHLDTNFILITLCLSLFIPSPNVFCVIFILSGSQSLVLALGGTIHVEHPLLTRLSGVA